MKKKIFAIFGISLFLFSCFQGKSTNMMDESFESIEKAARGTTVSFYMWGGSTIINNWIDGYVSDTLRKKYNITLKRIPMDANVFINKLLDQVKAGKKNGTMDLLWINGENFRNAMESGLLYGPFVPKLPNYTAYIDPASVEYDFGYPVRGYEAPYGKAQFVFEYDQEKIKEPPDTFKALLEWIKRNPGRFTYPQPPDFTGSAFIRQVFYAVTGGYQQYIDGYDEKLFSGNATALWSYLNEIKPFLWQKGITYPKDIATLDTLFERGEVDFNMSYHQAHAQNNISNGQYPGSVRTFVMKDGSIFNTHFLAIPVNAPNKAGAMAVINHILSIDVQLDKNMPENWGDFTVLDLARLAPDVRQQFMDIDLGAATLDLAALARYAVPEIASVYLEKLEQGWEENVLKK